MLVPLSPFWTETSLLIFSLFSSEGEEENCDLREKCAVPTRILKSLVLQSKSNPEPDHIVRLPSTRPVSMSLERRASEGDLKTLSCSTDKLFSKSPLVLLRQEASPSSTDEELVTTGVGAGVSSIHDHEAYGNETMDIYYQGMIQTYPGDALLLANYARFLKEVRGDGLKAEEYCERAILTSGGDGNVLSMYGGLVWSNHGDGARAQTYFDRALQSYPDDCYVMASYARFLWEWDAGQEEKSQFQSNSTHNNVPNQIPIPLTPDASYCFSKDNNTSYYT